MTWLRRDESGWVGSAATALDPLVNDETLILTIQNGLGAAERIVKYRAPDNILIGVAAGFGAIMRGLVTRFTTECS